MRVVSLASFLLFVSPLFSQSLQTANFDDIVNARVPQASARSAIAIPPFKDTDDLGIVATKFAAAFHSTGYSGQGWAYLLIPKEENDTHQRAKDTDDKSREATGFSVITQMEQFDATTGKSLPGGQRWTVADTSVAMTFMDLVKKVLLGAPIGHYRMFLFLVGTSSTNPTKQSVPGTYVQFDDYFKKLYREPMPDLKKVSLFQMKVDVFVLVYEFDRSTIDGEMKFRDTGLLTVDQHLKGSGLWQALNLDNK